MVNPLYKQAKYEFPPALLDHEVVSLYNATFWGDFVRKMNSIALRMLFIVDGGWNKTVWYPSAMNNEPDKNIWATHKSGFAFIIHCQHESGFALILLFNMIYLITKKIPKLTTKFWMADF